MNFDIARKVADAVLYEGYLLYPYRASAQKNQVRWQFGVLVPPAFAASGTGESDNLRVQCLVDPGTGDEVHIVVRFLHLQVRAVERWTGQQFQPVSSLDVGGRTHLTWDEAVQRKESFTLSLDALRRADEVRTCFAADSVEEELLEDEDGQLVGRITRRCWSLGGELVVGADAVPVDCLRLRIELRNTAAWTADVSDPIIDPARGQTRADVRDRALRRSLLGAHLLIGLSSGSFLSLADPPEWARESTAMCQQRGAWPVLIGDASRCNTMLCSPIILSDFPEVAPESPGDLFDATEIDEILTLRTMALTDAEKAEVRRTDRRAEAIIDRADHLPPEIMERLHGAIRSIGPAALPPSEAPASTLPARARPSMDDIPTYHTPRDDAVDTDDDRSGGDPPWWDPGMDASVSPRTDRYPVDGVLVGRGSVVTLSPGIRRADAQDMFLVDRQARVEAVLFDIEDNPTFAVTLLDDPAADLQAATGRFLYFSPDEVKPDPEPAT